MRAMWFVLLAGCSKAIVTPEFRWSETELHLEAVGHEHQQWIEMAVYGDRPARIGLDGRGLPIGTRIAVGAGETTITSEGMNLMLTVELEPYFAAAPIEALSSRDGFALPPVEIHYPEAENTSKAPLSARGGGDQIVAMLANVTEGPVAFAGEPASSGEDDTGVVITSVTGAGGSPERTVTVIGAPHTIGDLDMVALVDEAVVGAKVCGRYDGHDGTGLRDAAFTFTGRRVRLYQRRTGKKVIEKAFHDKIACPDSITYGGMADMDLKSGGAEADAWLKGWFMKGR